MDRSYLYGAHFMKYDHITGEDLFPHEAIVHLRSYPERLRCIDLIERMIDDEETWGRYGQSWVYQYLSNTPNSSERDKCRFSFKNSDAPLLFKLSMVL